MPIVSVRPKFVETRQHYVPERQTLGKWDRYRRPEAFHFTFWRDTVRRPLRRLKFGLRFPPPWWRYWRLFRCPCKNLKDQLARNTTITDPQAASSSTSQEGLGTDSTVYAIATQTGEEESIKSSTYSRQTKKRSFRFTRWQ